MRPPNLITLLPCFVLATGCGGGDVHLGDPDADAAGIDAPDATIPAIDAAPGPDAGPPPPGSAGLPCEFAEECIGDACIFDIEGFPGGYCTAEGCDLASPHASCSAFGPDAVCIDSVGGGFCFDGCDPAGFDCRDQYACGLVGGQVVCFPHVLGGGFGEVGDPCFDFEDCTGDACLGEFDGFPDGYCTDFACAPGFPCVSLGDGVCVDIDGIGLCLDVCKSHADCRDGYECFPSAAGDFCIPL